MADLNDAHRTTLDELIAKRAALLAECREITAALKTVLRLLPADERHPYSSAFDAGAEASRLPPDTTLADAAEAVLRDRCEPMRAGEIVTVLREWFYPYEKDDAAMQASIGGILARKAGREETFEKPEAGLFGLLEWQDEGEDDAASEPDPPPRLTVVRTGTDQRRAPAPRSGSDYEEFNVPSMGGDDDLPF